MCEKCPFSRIECIFSKLFISSSLSRTMLGYIFSHLNCMPHSSYNHLSSWMPGFLFSVEG